MKKITLSLCLSLLTLITQSVSADEGSVKIQNKLNTSLNYTIKYSWGLTTTGARAPWICPIGRSVEEGEVGPGQTSEIPSSDCCLSSVAISTKDGKKAEQADLGSVACIEGISLVASEKNGKLFLSLK